MLHSRHCRHLLVKVNDMSMVRVKILTNIRLNATVSSTFSTQILILAPHSIHICRRTAHVSDNSIEIRRSSKATHLIHDRFLTSRSNLLTLMRRNRTKRTPTKATPMGIDRVPNHLKSRHSTTLFVFRVRLTNIRKVKRSINLHTRHRRQWRIHHHRTFPSGIILHQISSLLLIAFSLYMMKILSMLPLRFLTFSKIMQSYHLSFFRQCKILRRNRICHLRQSPKHLQTTSPITRIQHSSHLNHRLFTHSVNQQICRTINQNGRFQFVCPIIIMSQSSHRSLHAAYNHRHIGINIFQDARIHIGSIVGAETITAARSISIIVAKTTCRSVMVHHRIHHARSNAKKESWCTEFSKISQVVSPVRLWYDSHTITSRLQSSTNYSRAERGMIHIGVATHNDNIDFRPAEAFHLVEGDG